jgi:chromosome partitioning protein
VPLFQRRDKSQRRKAATVEVSEPAPVATSQPEPQSASPPEPPSPPSAEAKSDDPTEPTEDTGKSTTVSEVIADEPEVVLASEVQTDLLADEPGTSQPDPVPAAETDKLEIPAAIPTTDESDDSAELSAPAPTDSSVEVAVVESQVQTKEAPRPHLGRTEESLAERAPMAIGPVDLPITNGAPKPRPLPRVIAIANQKGGVGKTTTTVNLGAALSELDYRVLVVDLDPQGNATSGLGIDTRNFEASMYDVIMRDARIEDCIEPTNVQNLFVTPATIDLAGVEIELVSAFSRELKLKRAVDTVVDDFDFVLIDCPPSLGLLTINGLAAAREVLVPIQCEYYALEGLSQLLRNVQLVASNLNSGLEVSAIVLTMFDARTRLALEVADEVRTHFKDRVCRSIIPRTVRLSEAPSYGQPITVFDPSSRGAVAYRELAKEVSNGAPKRSG